MKTIQHRKITVRTRTVKIVRTGNDNGEHAGHEHNDVCPLCKNPYFDHTDELIDVPQKTLPAIDECKTELTINK